MPVTPCPDIDRLARDAAAGLPGADARLDAHAAVCTACLAEAEAADDGFGDAFACLREETCPPEVLAAVFAEGAIPARARPAPLRADDRAARPTTRPNRRRVWAGVLTAAALVALVALWPRPEAPLVAETTPARTTLAETRETPDTAERTTDPTPVETAAATETATAVPATPRRARTAPRRRAAAPRPAPAAPAERLGLPDAPDLAETPTPADTAAARQDLLLAFGIVARAQRHADTVVQTEMQRVSAALEPAQLIQ